MPQSSNESPPLGAWPGGLLIALLIGLGAIGWVQTPFKPERPSESKEGLRTVGVQDVDARLWQDPFAAVAAARKARKEAKGPECRAVEIGGDGRSLLIRGTCPEGAGPGPRAVDDHALERLRDQIRTRAEALGPKRGQYPGIKPVRVLGVMVSAGPSPGSTEARRRYRYAALSALMLEGFMPDDAEHVGYADLGQDGTPELIPFEWLTRRTDDPQHQALLLLWLNDDSLSALEQPKDGAGASTAQGIGHGTSPVGAPRPLRRLSSLLSRLAPAEVQPDWIDFQLIGPAGSGSLEAMAKEYREYLNGLGADRTAAASGAGSAGGSSAGPGPEPGPEPGPGPGPEPAPRLARIWSPFATIPDPAAALPQTGPPLCPPDVAPSACIGVRPPAPTERTIASDDTLARLLAEELRRRHITGKARVALVGQWDTAYSRRLAEEVEGAWRCAQARPGTPSCEKASHTAQGVAIWVPRFSYMRGIDGQIPGGKASTEEAARAIERPGGEAQTDYLRRMRDAMLAEDARLRQRCGWLDRMGQRCGIRAIGVLGNDYFDKVLVLQALKPVFPDAVFFTTDLDAGMLHPQDNPFTRNLTVASGFGLTLDRAWQREVPPLRDSYQTALLLTVRLAVRQSLCLQPEVQIPPPPRLFEIGRTRAVELVTEPVPDPDGGFRREAPSPWQDLGHDPHPVEDLQEHFRIWPAGGDAGAPDQAGTSKGQGARADRPPSVPVIALPLATLLALALVAAAFGRERTPRRLRQALVWLRAGRPSAFVAAVTVVTIWAVLVLMGRDLADGGEPFSLLEGVSIWPSELLRLAAGILALVLFFLAQTRQGEARRRIAADYPGLSTAHRAQHSGEGTDPAGAQDDAQSLKQGADAGGTSPCTALLAWPAARPTPAVEIWRRYAGSCGPQQTLRRIWPEVLGFLLLAYTLMLALGFPNRPTRSDLSWGLDFVVILLMLIPFLALLFFMVDATRQALDLARGLRAPIAWPAQTLRTLGLGAWLPRPQGQGAAPAAGARGGDAGAGPPPGPDLPWLKVRLVAAVTRPVGNLVWYPVAVLILIALARHPLFDAWSLPPALILIMAIALVYAVGCAWALRRAAEAVREDAVGQLSAAILRAQGRSDAKECLEPLKTMLAAVMAIREGAFRPFTQQPVVQALLTLVSSVSGLALLEYSSMANL